MPTSVIYMITYQYINACIQTTTIYCYHVINPFLIHEAIKYCRIMLFKKIELHIRSLKIIVYTHSDKYLIYYYILHKWFYAIDTCIIKIESLWLHIFHNLFYV